MATMYTIALSNWRRALTAGIPLLDITVKSGDRVFAPTWDIVMGVKSGSITEEEYTERYTTMMRHSQERAPDRWRAVSDGPAVALACYCRPGAFCHRHLLVNLLTQYCVTYHLPFSYRGELT